MKLFVKETSGQYREATNKEVFSGAKILANLLLAKGEMINSSESVKDFLTAQLLGLEKEIFGALFLNTQHQIIEYREMFTGTIDSCAVYPREIVKAALDLSASAVIICHNHPSGSLEASAPDRAVTKKIREVLELFDIRLLDHIIVAGSQAMSFNERGLI